MSIGQGWYKDSEPLLDQVDDIAVQLLKDKFDIIFGTMQRGHQDELETESGEN